MQNATTASIMRGPSWLMSTNFMVFLYKLGLISYNTYWFATGRVDTYFIDRYRIGRGEGF